MSDPKAKAGILSLATDIPRAYHSADYIASHSETPAEVIRTKLGWYQKNVSGPGDGTVAMGLKDEDLVLMISASIGYTWDVLLLRCGQTHPQKTERE